LNENRNNGRLGRKKKKEKLFFSFDVVISSDLKTILFLVPIVSLILLLLYACHHYRKQEKQKMKSIEGYVWVGCYSIRLDKPEKSLLYMSFLFLIFKINGSQVYYCKLSPHLFSLHLWVCNILTFPRKWKIKKDKIGLFKFK